MQRTSRTAILLFARTAAADTEAKCWMGNARKDRQLARTLNRETLRLARRTGLPVRQVSEAKQRGVTFGERLANAVAATFAAGYERLLIIGNDCPQLRTAHLLRAARLLHQREIVLGPARDGGLYLLGIRATAFNATGWRQFSWQSSTLFAEWHKQQPEAYVLGTLADVDTAADLAALSKQCSRTLLSSRLLYLLNISAVNFSDVIRGRSVRLVTAIPTRGPPRAASF